MTYLRSIRFLLTFAVFVPALLTAQTPIQVVTKIIEKEWPYQAGEALVISGDKAEIIIRGQAGNTVKLKLKLVAKHPERDVAASEVSYLRYVINHTKEGTEIANRFVIPQSTRQVRSNLKAIYELSVPFGCIIRLQNKYGTVQVSQLEKELQATLEFSSLALNDVRGKIGIQSEYSDITGSAVAGEFTCQANKATIQLRELGGSSRITNTYGSIDITPGSTLQSLVITASRTAVTFRTGTVEKYQYNLSTRFSEIHLPGVFSEQHRKNLTGKQTFVFTPQPALPAVAIQTTYSPITLQLK